MAQFRTLPIDVVDCIVQALCLGCSPGPDRCCSHSDCLCLDTDRAEYTRAAALAALCRTSRWLNNISTRHLYHGPVCGRLALLARTLLARKDLAQRVRVLRIDEWDEGVLFDPSDFSRIAPEVLAYFNPQFQAYLDSLSQEEREEIAYSPWPVPLEKQPGPEDDRDHSLNISVDILTSLCPNLEALYTDTADLDVFRLCTPRSMMRLQTVVVSHYYNRMSDTMSRTESLARLFRAAPNVSDITLHAVRKCPDPGHALDDVRSLDLRASVLGDGELVKFFSMCPNLETFRYEAGRPSTWRDHFSLPRAQDAIFAHTPRLKFLSLSIAFDGRFAWDHACAREMKRVLAERGIVLSIAHSRRSSSGSLQVRGGQDAMAPVAQAPTIDAAISGC